MDTKLFELELQIRPLVNYFWRDEIQNHISASYWIPILMKEIEDNRENIDVNRGNIEENTENLQDNFRDTMNFDAITLIENAYLETGGVILPDGPLVVEINGYQGYACDTDGTVDQHTADLLCQEAGFPSGANSFYTQGGRLKIYI